MDTVFPSYLIARAAMSSAEAERFRRRAARRNLSDPDYGDSITVYIAPDGSMMVDSIELSDNAPISANA